MAILTWLLGPVEAPSSVHRCCVVADGRSNAFMVEYSGDSGDFVAGRAETVVMRAENRLISTVIGFGAQATRVRLAITTVNAFDRPSTPGTDAMTQGRPRHDSRLREVIWCGDTPK